VQIFKVISQFRTIHTTGLLFLAGRGGCSVLANGRVQQGKILLAYLASYRGADKSLARPGWKQATATEDFEFHISYLLS
jgi:hypothetical protein